MNERRTFTQPPLPRELTPRELTRASSPDATDGVTADVTADAMAITADVHADMRAGVSDRARFDVEGRESAASAETHADARSEARDAGRAAAQEESPAGRARGTSLFAGRARAEHTRPVRTLRTAALVMVAFGAGACAASFGSGLAGAAPEASSPYATIAQLGRVLVQIENHYVEPVERRRLVEGAIKGMVSELDPHSSYLPPEDFRQFQADTEGKFGGIGVEVDGRNDQLTVIAPIEGSPADRAGMRSGDKIIKVDDESVEGASLDKVVLRMRGAPGTHVKVTVRRVGVRDPIVFDLVREVIKVASVTTKLLDEGVAYVRIKQFQDRTHDELVTAVGKLRAEAGGDLRGVILDLRSNPGGLVDEAAEVADEFLTGGTIFSTRHRGKILDEVKARGGGSLSGIPAVVLVNEWSASASELVAGALQDNKRALVVGVDTFGKGSVQTILDLPGGAGLRLTTARYYTPSGHAIQADGVHPDVVVESSRVVAERPQVVKERDLGGHLPAEGLPREPKRRVDAGAPPVDGGAPAEPTADGGAGGLVNESASFDVRRMPTNPSESPDFVLRIGYQLVRASMAGRGPVPR